MALIKLNGKPLEKLIETTAKGIGILYEPRRIRKKGEAEAYVLEQMNKAKASGLLLQDETNATIEERAKTRLMLQEVQRQDNIESILDKSIKYLGENVNPEPVNPDWRARFFNKSQDVSNENLQEIWARIIAEEITSPGNFSLRTLDVLSNLTNAEAKIFEKLCKLTFTNGAILDVYGDIPYDKYGISFYELSILRSFGLVYQDEPTLTLTRHDHEGQKGFFIADGKKAFFFLTEDASKMKFKIIHLTSVGHELRKLIVIDTDEDYVRSVLSYINSRGIDHMEIDIKTVPDDFTE